MKKTLKIIMLVVSFMIIFSIGTKIEAATASISASSSVTVGKSVTVTVKVNAATWNLKVSGSTSGTIVGFNMSGKNESTTKTFKFTPSKEGDYTVSLTGDITDANGKTSDINKKTTIKAKKASENDNSDDNKSTSGSNSNKSKSSNANLTTLGITPKDYDFSGFSKDKTSYSVTVPNDVDSLKVNYKAADSKAKVKVTGNDDLEVGTNNIKVVVTAEDGTTKTYTIKVTKLATEDNKPGNVIDEENDLNLYLTSLSIDGLELSPAFDKNVFSYTTTIDMDTNDMSEVKVNAEANDSKATVEITGNTNLVEGENLINIVVKGTESSEQTVYQITVNKISQASEIASNNIFDKIKNIKKEYLIIGGFIFIVVVIIIILIINHIRNKKYYNEMNEDGYYDNNEENENETSNFNERPQDNFIEELYKKRNNGEKLNKQDEETIEDIENENDRIFNKPKKGETVEYSEDTDKEDIEEEQKDEPDFLEERKEKRRKGKHF